MKGMAILAFLTALLVFLRQTGLIDAWKERTQEKTDARRRALKCDKAEFKPKEYDHQWNEKGELDRFSRSTDRPNRGDDGGD